MLQTHTPCLGQVKILFCFRKYLTFKQFPELGMNSLSSERNPEVISWPSLSCCSQFPHTWHLLLCPNVQNHTLPSQQILWVWEEQPSHTKVSQVTSPESYNTAQSAQAGLRDLVSREGTGAIPTEGWSQISMSLWSNLSISPSWTKPTFPWDNSHVTSADSWFTLAQTLLTQWFQ